MWRISCGGTTVLIAGSFALRVTALLLLWTASEPQSWPQTARQRRRRTLSVAMSMLGVVSWNGILWRP